MNERIAKNALTFLGRVSVQAREIPSFLEVVSVLENIAGSSSALPEQKNNGNNGHPAPRAEGNKPDQQEPAS